MYVQLLARESRNLRVHQMQEHEEGEDGYDGSLLDARSVVGLSTV